MSKLPIISGFKAVKALSKLGYKIDHQTGSHMILRHEEPPYRRLTIPNHKELAKGNFKSNNKAIWINSRRIFRITLKLKRKRN